MKVASWNVNSVAARRERLLAWLARHQPEVLCLQELKALDDAFPREEVEALGYQVALHGQRTYNGVAILSKLPLADVRRGLSDDVPEADSRLISARIGEARVVCCYVPNGQSLTSDKYPYKLAWLDRLKAHLARYEEPLLVCGDFNIAPEDRDVYDPEGLRDDVLVHESVREKFRALIATGLVDTYRLHVEDAGKYSWWDYRQLGFPKNRGLRIDFVLASTKLACTGAGIDRDERKGKLPSDHAPVWAELTL
ncbi:MAG TPA: exodeoxyribonuclease III [Polyangiales bacterium]|nr:exodeoxyribonuclease III [Polyangiales bacterium]